MASRPIREMPGHVVVRRMKARRVRQLDVALRVGTSSGTVSQTIHRSPTVSKALAARIWTAIEEALR